MNQPAPGASAPPDVIYIIRHGEKPADPPALDPGQPSPAPGPPFGVDYEGNQDEHSLLPRGWQRSGALAVLFDPALGRRRAELGGERQARVVDPGRPAARGPARGQGGDGRRVGDRGGLALDGQVEVMGRDAQGAARIAGDVPALPGVLAGLEPRSSRRPTAHRRR
jgi:hypothetical protein